MKVLVLVLVLAVHLSSPPQDTSQRAPRTTWSATWEVAVKYMLAVFDTKGAGETGVRSNAVDVNASGITVGYETEGQFRPLVFSAGQALPLDAVTTLGWANGINAGGVVVGTAGRAVVWSNSARLTLPLIGGEDPLTAASQAMAINDRNQIVGWSSTDLGYVTHAVLWDRGGVTDLGSLGSASAAYAVNEAGTAVGASSLERITEYRAIDPLSGAPDVVATVWSDGAIAALPGLGGSTSVALDVNDHGTIVGHADTDHGTKHAVVWRDGSLHDLGDGLGGGWAQARGINNADVAVGAALDARARATIAVLWRGGTLTDLNDALVYPGPWRLTEANAINDLGQIAARACRDARCYASLLTPLPVGLAQRAGVRASAEARSRALDTPARNHVPARVPAYRHSRTTMRRSGGALHLGRGI